MPFFGRSKSKSEKVGMAALPATLPSVINPLENQDADIQHPQYLTQNWTAAEDQTDETATAGHGVYGGVYGSNKVDNEQNYVGHAFVEDNPYAPGGIGCTQSSGGPIKISPTRATTTSQSSGGTSQRRLTGKFQSALGSLIGSETLKAKGLQKEQEANSGKQLEHAELLEPEALLRPERAVGQDDHPVNSSLDSN